MEEIDLKEVFKTFWNKKFHILVILIIFVILGIIFTLNFVTPKYTSYTTLILASVNNNSNSLDNQQTVDTSTIEKDITVNSKLVSTYSVLIKSKNILRQVMTNLGIDMDEDELKKNIDVSTVEETEVIRISVTDEDPSLACSIANEIANVFKDQIKGYYYNIENVQIVDVAEEDYKPSNINHKKDIAIFVLLGMVASCGYVLVLNMLDTTVKSIEDIENIKGVTVLASLPAYDEELMRVRRGGTTQNEK